jgi:hypothetical protein
LHHDLGVEGRLARREFGWRSGKWPLSGFLWVAGWRGHLIAAQALSCAMLHVILHQLDHSRVHLFARTFAIAIIL